jgi:hypothetical protein
MQKIKLSKLVRRIIMGLPLAAVVIMNLFPISVWARQFLIGITLIWFQVFILSEVFTRG